MTAQPLLTRTLATPPAVSEIPPVRVRGVSRSTLSNDLALTVVSHGAAPRVELRLTVPAGTAMTDRPAVAELTRRGLSLGTREIDQHQLSEELQLIGGSLQVRQDQDSLQIVAAALAEAEEELYQLVAAVVTEPHFQADQLATEKESLVEELAVARATPYFPVIEQVQQLVYGVHPYGQLEPSESAVHRTGRQALLDFHRLCFSPSSSQLTVVGNLDRRRTISRLRRAFEGWRGPRRVPTIPPVRAGRAKELTLIDRPGSVQTATMVCCSTPTLPDPDYPVLGLASSILGGSFSSRMFANLREDKGYTYSPHSRMDSHLRDALFSATMEVRTEVTAPALCELWYELGRLATVPVGEEELEGAKRYLAGTRVLMLQTQSGLASALAQLQLYGLDHRYLEGYSARLAKITADDVLQVSAKYLAPTRVTAVLAGDAGAVEEGLRSLAEVRVRGSRRR